MSRIVLEKGDKRKHFVKQMFNDVAHRYDFLNHFLSAGIDILWRKKAIASLDINPRQVVLDVACGTADLTMEAHRQKKCRVIGADIAKNMLTIGQKKIKKSGYGDYITFALCDGEKLPFADSVFDAAIIAFGVRNMGDINQALKEMNRTLKVNGQIMLLEFSLPASKLFRKPYLFYFNKILPAIGRLISGDASAYRYLPASVENFPSVAEFREQMREAGFTAISDKRLLSGVAVIYTGKSNKIQSQIVSKISK